MSGPIIRKYGFPNFDQIFGKRDLEHGQDEPVSTPTDAPDATTKSEDPVASKETSPTAPAEEPKGQK